jgi:hypothetical protein
MIAADMSSHNDAPRTEDPDWWPDEDSPVARLLRRDRPTLSRSSERRIRREVMAAAAKRERPQHLSMLILVYLACGVLLLALAALGLAGVGPLAF